MIDEKWTEIERDVIDKLRKYIDEQVGTTNADSEFFQTMEDLVLPVMESCLAKDILDDKHLDQHLKELSEYEEKMEKITASTNELEYDLACIKDLARKL